MFINTSPQVSSIFLKKAEGRQTMPIMLMGQYGQGRFHFLSSYIRQVECRKDYQPLNHTLYLERCNCMSCVKIARRKTPDLVVLEGTEGIAEAREKVAQFKDSRPSELSRKYLILRNVEYFSKEILDTALKIIEEPMPGQEILATMQPADHVSGAFKSRFILLTLPTWSQENLQNLVEHFEVFKPFKSVLEKSEVSTPYELTLFPSVTELVVNLWAQASSISGLMEALEQSKKRIEDSAAPNQALMAALKHYIAILRKIPNPAFQAQLLSLLNSFDATLFRYASKVNSSYQMNTDNQLFGFLSAVLLIRKSLKC